MPRKNDDAQKKKKVVKKVLKDIAWAAQSKSLKIVQNKGTTLEKYVCGILGCWEIGKVTYDIDRGYKLQVDAVFPKLSSPKVIISITYTSPDKPGHSNENKFQLKVGELALFKRAFPNVCMILVIGGTKEAWLPYVLKAFEFFYDEVIFLWTTEGVERLKQIARNPKFVKQKNRAFWSDMTKEWNTRAHSPSHIKPPKCSLRYEILDDLKKQKPIVHNPNLIKNEIARLCLARSYENEGAEWKSYLRGQWHSIEMSRNYFNPVEAAVEISLKEAGFEFKGSVASNVKVNSLLEKLGMRETKLSEDFVLYSEKLEMPVYIQCKSSGGGREQHGKNIQNRTKEQITRNILYRCDTSKGELIWASQNFHWISVLDGNWGVTAEDPLKYIHMLELAGYNKIFGSDELLARDYKIKRQGNPLVIYLHSLKCRKKP